MTDRFVIISYAIIYILLFSACGKNKSKYSETADKEKVIIPSELSVYQPFDDYKMDSMKIAQSKYKIYSIIDVSCGSCVGSIKLWKEFDFYIKNKRASIILICHSSDSFQSFEYVMESDKEFKFPYPFFYDINNEFISLNKNYLADKNAIAILTDENNKIIHTGNPIDSNRDKNRFLEIINN